MPRKKITMPHAVEYLSILDEKGKLDKKLEPAIPKELLLKLYRFMVLGAGSTTGFWPFSVRAA